MRKYSVCLAYLSVFLLLGACQSLHKETETAMSDYSPGYSDEDHFYLEEVTGELALDEVRQWNKRSLARLESTPLYETLYGQALEVLNSDAKIPYVSYRGGQVHNFWQDAIHVRGLWRRTSLEDYLTDTPHWETVLDFDRLAADENKNWVFKGNDCLPPDYELCLVELSNGGKDAVVRREFNARTKTFVPDGFVTPESKGAMVWLDKDRVLVAIDFGTDEQAQPTLTRSGYPRVVKLWQRGTPLSAAQTLLTGTTEDVGVWPSILNVTHSHREIVLARARTFFEWDYFWVPQSGELVKQAVPVPLPGKSSLGNYFKGQVLLALHEDWRGFEGGDLISFSLADFMLSGEIADIHLVVRPDTRSAMIDNGVTQSKLLVSLSRDVVASAYAFDWDGRQWTSQKLDFPTGGTISISATNAHEKVAFIGTESFLQPDNLWALDSQSLSVTRAKSLPDWFDADNMSATQFFAISKDGTQVPYFVIRQKQIVLDGRNPTLLYGYGGFEVSLTPGYLATRGRLWMERGGVYVQANIRGGGEYGPDWHQAGLKTQRQKIYDDFIAVAEDLIARKITSPAHLGIEGGSNGGLLVGVMVTQRPDLFNAAVCAVPLLDMMRYHKWLAGASWIEEYGNPEDPEEGAFLRSISPYHNLDPDTDYPEVLFLTSTKDDRVHPAHARKMARRMQDQAHPFLYYENIDGGHSAAANLRETARRLALQHVYLWQKLAD